MKIGMHAMVANLVAAALMIATAAPADESPATEKAASKPFLPDEPDRVFANNPSGNP